MRKQGKIWQNKEIEDSDDSENKNYHNTYSKKKGMSIIYAYDYRYWKQKWNKRCW